MIRKYLSGPLFDREPGAGGGQDGVITVEPGAPYEHDLDAPRDEPKPEKSDVEKRLEALERDNNTLRTRVQQSEDDARFWQRRASAEPKETRVVVEREEPAAAPAPEMIEKPAKFMDDLTTGGLRALVDKGVITHAQFMDEIERREQALLQTVDDKIATARADAEFGAQLNTEFPDIMQLSNAIAAGEETLESAGRKSPLWAEATKIYRQSIARDPALQGTKSALLLACREAKKNLGTEDKGGRRDDGRREGREPVTRRDRVERQAPPRGRDDDAERDDEGFSQEQTEVMRRLKVKPEEFKKHRDVAARGARRAR